MDKLYAGAALAALTMLLDPISPPSAFAQDTTGAGKQPSPGISEIIVTARKRRESIMNVPVVESVIGRTQLQRFQTQNLKDIATLVPGLSIGDSVLSIGTQVSLRGIGTTTYDPGIDQSVALNIDGIQFSQGLAYASGFFDVAQVEALKGPQALFYGKSSPGGVIAVRTNDPTDKPEFIARAGYEAEARERRTELVASGPITNTLKLRVAGFYDDQDGYFFNNAYAQPNTGGVSTNGRLDPQNHWQIRGTAIWTPTPDFDARLKINDVYDRTLRAATEKYTLCPDGTAPVQLAPGVSFPNFIGGANTCDGLSRRLHLVDLDPAAYGGLPNGGVPFLENSQIYGSLEMNYKVTPEITLTSVTGLYSLHSDSLLNAAESAYAGGAIAVTNHFDRRDATEELRVNTSYTGPLNFTGGYYYQDSQFADLVDVRGNSMLGLFALPNELTKGQNVVGIRTNSIFGQARWTIIPRLELAAGVRWTDERRSDDATSFTAPVGPVPLAMPHIQSDNFSPEVTITYRPTDDLTAFGSLKQAYKSGSYDVATPATPGEDNAFGDEKVQGGEFGTKARLLDRHLLVDLAFYDYYYTGLQVGGIIDMSGVPVTKTINAGAAQTYGIDFDSAYRPPAIEELGLNVSAEWNEAHFNTLTNAQCYGGQTIAEGCNLAYSPFANAEPAPLGTLGGFTNQNLSGTPLVRAPELQLNFGFDYDWALNQNLKLIISNANHFSTRYSTDLDFAYYQKAYVKTDLSLTLQGPNDRWDVALIGKNLSDVITTGNCVNSFARGGAVLPYQFTGYYVSGPGGHDTIGCFEDRGRELWLTLTVKVF